MHASQLSVSLLQFTNPFGILTILAFLLFVNNSEKIELWVPLMGPLLRYLGPLFAQSWIPFGSPFQDFWVPFWLCNSALAKGSYERITKECDILLGYWYWGQVLKEDEPNWLLFWFIWYIGNIDCFMLEHLTWCDIMCVKERKRHKRSNMSWLLFN